MNSKYFEYAEQRRGYEGMEVGQVIKVWKVWKVRQIMKAWRLSHDDSRKPIYIGVKRSRSQVTKTVPSWAFALL